MACGDDGSGGNNDEVGDGDGDSNGSGDGDGDGGDGTTPCGTFGTEEVTCQAGQYCADSVLSLCENGCLNNANCAGDQVCEKDSGQNVGTCQNTGGSGPTEQEFCDKWNACDPDGDLPITCEMIYAASSVACHECIIENNCNDIAFDDVCDEACGW
jgi:hypothetical protein